MLQQLKAKLGLHSKAVWLPLTVASPHNDNDASTVPKWMPRSGSESKTSSLSGSPFAWKAILAIICVSAALAIYCSPSILSNGQALSAQASDRAILGQNVSLAEFLNSQAPLARHSTLWVTLADGNYARKAVPHLAQFLKHDSDDDPEMLVFCTNAA